MGYAIHTHQLSKSFGDVRAVVGLDLAVEVGEVFGFLGPNGAGKSTTIKLLLDELRPSSGSATVLGLDAHRDVVEVHRRVGYLPGELSMPSDLTGGEYLDFLAKLRRLDDHDVRRDLVERFDLDLSRRLGQLSTGNKQKVGLVQAFMHRPELVLLDEPTTGLDPLVQHDFHEFLIELAGEGTTVFLSSHTLSEVDRVADRVGIIRRGQLVAIDAVSALKSRALHRVDIEFAAPPLVNRLEHADGVRTVEVRGSVAAVTIEGPVDHLLRCALEAGTVVSIETPQPDLEEVFLDYYRDDQQQGDA